MRNATQMQPHAKHCEPCALRRRCPTWRARRASVVPTASASWGLTRDVCSKGVSAVRHASTSTMTGAVFASSRSRIRTMLWAPSTLPRHRSNTGTSTASDSKGTDAPCRTTEKYRDASRTTWDEGYAPSQQQSQLRKTDNTHDSPTHTIATHTPLHFRCMRPRCPGPQRPPQLAVAEPPVPGCGKCPGCTAPPAAPRPQ